VNHCLQTTKYFCLDGEGGGEGVVCGMISKFIYKGGQRYFVQVRLMLLVSCPLLSAIVYQVWASRISSTIPVIC
jgi:hypothetical protein